MDECRKLALSLARECGISEPSTQKLEMFFCRCVEEAKRQCQVQSPEGWKPIETAPEVKP